MKDRTRATRLMPFLFLALTPSAVFAQKSTATSQASINCEDIDRLKQRLDRQWTVAVKKIAIKKEGIADFTAHKKELLDDTAWARGDAVGIAVVMKGTAEALNSSLALVAPAQGKAVEVLSKCIERGISAAKGEKALDAAMTACLVDAAIQKAKLSETARTVQEASEWLGARGEAIASAKSLGEERDALRKEVSAQVKRMDSQIRQWESDIARLEADRETIELAKAELSRYCPNGVKP